ncbi:MAG: carboxypeptidase-like regulatory domain-containing protein [Clostridia bacterium]
MPNVSGVVSYNGAHLAVLGTPMPGIPVGLYNTTTGMGAVAITDALGAYLFTNVPAGNYNIIESWGTSGVASPVNFTALQTPMAQPLEVEPPLSALTFIPPALADALDAVTPNLIKIVVAASDFTNQNFIDGPVGLKPLTLSGITLTGSNLITVADNGTMGTFAPGTASMTTNPVAPYPAVTPGFVYTTNTKPSDGQYTVMNTRISNNEWWGVSDHTTGIETGRFMLVNGANPGATIFQQTTAVSPNTDYMLTAWILNLLLLNGYALPKLALEVLDANGNQLFFQNVNPIPYTPIPVWYQNGFKFNTAGNSSITVKILSEGPAAEGNDYLIDDVQLFKAVVKDAITVKKSAAPDIVYNGTDVTFTVVVTNTATTTTNNVIFKDILDPTLVFVPGSVTVDNIPNLAANPNAGFSLGNMPPATSHTVVFHATALPGASTVKNMATGTYNAITSATGDVVTQTVNSNVISLHRPLYNLSRPSIDIATSVALEQTALSHILNAEGEKIQAMLAIPAVTADNLLAVNESVNKMVDSTTLLESVLQQKLEIVKNQLVSC